MTAEDAQEVLAGFELRTATYGGKERELFVAGSGPAVLVLHEMPGITPEVVRFARAVIARGFTVWLPVLLGNPGAALSGRALLAASVRACVAREFTMLARGRTSPAVSWLRELAAHAHRECGGVGVGVVGMCFTGGYALGMMVDVQVRAPVLSQPATPLPLGAKRKADPGVSQQDLERVKERAAEGAFRSPDTSCARAGARLPRGPAPRRGVTLAAPGTDGTPPGEISGAWAALQYAGAAVYERLSAGRETSNYRGAGSAAWCTCGRHGAAVILIDGERMDEPVSKSDEIIAAARGLFSDKGYAATSMRDIADAVGLQPGSLYAHIERKEDILFEIVDRASDEFISNVIPVLTDSSMNAAMRLRMGMRAHLWVIANNLESARVYFHEWRALNGERYELVLKKRRRYERQFRDLLSEGKEGGEFRSIDERLASIGVLSLMNWTYTWYSPDGPLGPDELGDHFADLIIDGLGVGRRGARKR